MKTKPKLATVLPALSLLAAAIFLTARPAAPQPGRGSVNNHFSLSEADKALHGRPVMISAVRDGQVVEQQETQFPNDKRLTPLPPGVYDIRAEGDGMVTEVKRGVHLFPDREIDLIFAVHAGKGVHIVEYATGGLSREEVAARLAKLEAAVTQLQKSLPPK